MESYGRKIETTSLKVRTRFPPPNLYHSYGGSLLKLLNNIAKFEILNFLQFFVVLFGTFNMVIKG